MSIFDRVTCHESGLHNVRKPSLTFNVEETGNVTDAFSYRNEYIIQLSLKQNFWATYAERAGVQKDAERALAAYLYQDILSELPHLTLAINSGDMEEALNTVLRIKSAMEP